MVKSILCNSILQHLYYYLKGFEFRFGLEVGMSVRKRNWITGEGVQRSAWMADYKDQKGRRRSKSFGLKRDAENYLRGVTNQIADGVFVTDDGTETVQAAGKIWLQRKRQDGLERSTLDQYEQHLKLHIVPFLGQSLLTALRVPHIREFEDALRNEGRSQALISKIITSFGSLIGDAQERGKVNRNVVAERKRSRGGAEARIAKRQKKRLQVGVDIPTSNEISAFIRGLDLKWRPLFLTAILTGLRASELRGLTWENVDLRNSTLKVVQRADRYGVIGSTKSAGSNRAVPLSPALVGVLREWKLICPRRELKNGAPGKLDLVFPNGAGNVESLANIVNRGLKPMMVKAAVVKARGGKVGAKYTGMHALRHFHASLCINRVADGALGMSVKMLQERLGHATVTITLDTYSHLFPNVGGTDDLARAEKLLGVEQN